MILFNLEEDLQRSDLREKVKSNPIYAQNLYAALCNVAWQKGDNEYPWSCSWRYAGGLVSNLIGQGDYLDFYCSGTFSEDGYVGEGTVTEEIQNDLSELGWHPIYGD